MNELPRSLKSYPPFRAWNGPVRRHAQASTPASWSAACSLWRESLGRLQPGPMGSGPMGAAPADVSLSFHSSSEYKILETE